MRRIASTLAALSLVAAACGGDGGSLPDDAFAFGVSGDIGIGSERLLVAVGNPAAERLSSPDLGITIKVWPEADDSASQTQPGTFMWAIEDVSGLYRATFEFDAPGVWVVEVTPDDGEALAPFPISVLSEPQAPAVGDPAPRSDTFTLDDGPLALITTDPEPSEDFYRLSVADAVENGRPTVVIFSTPRFCQTAVCGPTLDLVRGVSTGHPEVDFVHVEVFTNLDDPNNLELVPAITEWGLPSEPWVFVVDEAGFVSARFEGLISVEELEAALT